MWRFCFRKRKMRKNIYGRRLKRDIKERKALFRTLMREMVLRGQIKTTEAKAKAVKPELEKVITKAIKNPTPEYFLNKKFQKDITDRIVGDIAPKFKNRAGGYTRITKLGNRTKDDASMVLLEWVEKVEAVPTKAPKKNQQKKSGTSSSQTKKKAQKESKATVAKKATQAPRAATKKAVRRVQKKG